MNEKTGMETLKLLIKNLQISLYWFNIKRKVSLKTSTLAEGLYLSLIQAAARCLFFRRIAFLEGNFNYNSISLGATSIRENEILQMCIVCHFLRRYLTIHYLKRNIFILVSIVNTAHRTLFSCKRISKFVYYRQFGMVLRTQISKLFFSRNEYPSQIKFPQGSYTMCFGRGFNRITIYHEMKRNNQF